MRLGSKKHIFSGFLLSLALLAAGHTFPVLALASVGPDAQEFHHDSVPHTQTTNHISCTEDLHETLSRQEHTYQLDYVNLIPVCIDGSDAFLAGNVHFAGILEKPPLPHPLDSKTILRL